LKHKYLHLDIRLFVDVYISREFLRHFVYIWMTSTSCRTGPIEQIS